MRMTLIEIVKDILNDLDSEDVDSISYTHEATQVANMVKSTYYNMVSNRTIPEHRGLFKLEDEASTFPTSLLIPENCVAMEDFWYRGEDTYLRVVYKEMEDFLSLTNRDTGTYYTEPYSQQVFNITEDAHPQFYTIFDDERILTDSFDSTIDVNGLVASKTRCFGQTIPVFNLEDAFVPDIDANMFPALVSEAKSYCFAVLKGGADPVVDRAARRNRFSILNDKERNKEGKRQGYGRVPRKY